MNKTPRLVVRKEDGEELDLDALGPTTSVTQAGMFLGISRGAAYQAAHAGELPTIRLGRRMLVPTAALRRMLEGNSRPAA